MCTEHIHHQKPAPPTLPSRPLQQGRVFLTSPILTYEQKSSTSKVRFANDCVQSDVKVRFASDCAESTTTSTSDAVSPSTTSTDTTARQHKQQVHTRHTSMPATAALLHKFYSNGSNSSSDAEMQTVTFADVSGLRSPTVDKSPTVQTGSPPQQFTIPSWKSFTKLVGMLIQAPSQQQQQR
jgi:predicted naringenin-chalcone synthase